MNLLRINGGILNGARVVFASAVVAITASASIGANATYVYRGQGVINGSATVTASSYALIPTASSIVGQAYLLPTAQHTQALQSNITGKAEVSAFVLRFSTGAADFGGIAEAVFVPASTFAFSDILCSADLSGDATKVQPGHAAAVCIADATGGDPTVFRMVEGHILGTCNWWVEPGVNGVYDAYWDADSVATVSIQDEGLITKVVGAILPGIADFTAVQTLNQRISGHASGTCAFSAQAVVSKIAGGSFVATAQLSAEATYQFRGAASPTGAGQLAVLSTSQRHVVRADLAASANVSGAASYVYRQASNLSGSASLTGQATYQYRSQAAVLGTCNIQPQPTHTHIVFGNAICTASAEGVGTIPIPQQGLADMASVADVTPFATLIQLAFADIDASAEVFAAAFEDFLGDDPAERTFVRPESVRMFVRPETVRVFTRV